MNGARVRLLRQWLGLEERTLAPLLGVAEPRVRDYEHERRTIHPAVAQRLEALVQRADDEVDAVLASLEGQDEPRVVIYRSNAELWAARPRLRPMPVGWHRMVISRVVDAMPDVEVAYPPQEPG